MRRELRGARIFITGGTGFIGKWLLESILAANEKFHLHLSICVLSRRPGLFARRCPRLAASPALRLVRGDVRDFEFPRGTFTHLIHGAADFSPALLASNAFLAADTIVRGTLRTLAFAARRRIGKTLFISSGAVYGRQPPRLARLPETFTGAPDPAAPASAYAEGKRAAEMLCSAFAAQSGLQAVIARPFAFIGPYLPLDAQYAAGNFIRDAMSGGPIVVKGDGTALRSYLYAADMAAWLLTILARGRSGAAYNVGGERAISIAGLARAISAECASRPEVLVLGNRSIRSAPDRYIPSTARAREELGLRAWIGLKAAVRRTLAFHGAALNAQ